MSEIKNKFRAGLLKSIKNGDVDNTFPEPKKLVKSSNGFDISSVIVNEEFQHIIDEMNGHDNMFITGDAGTGKSTVVNYFLATTNKNVAILAPTGIASINIGGQTIHSFFKFKPGPINTSKLIYSRYFANLANKLDAIIIDEISMVRCDMMDAMDAKLRLHRDEPNIPFGGVQMIMVGDLCQLPPVMGSGMERLYISNKYDSRYFFHSNAIKQSGINKFRLTKIYRQQDLNFIKILNHMRDGSLTDRMIAWLNARCCNRPRGLDSVYLCTTNSIAQRMNDQGMDELSGKTYTYKTIINGDFRLSGTRFKEKIDLKVDAKIMMIKNDAEGRWVNGTMGRVVGLSDNMIKVKIDGQTFEVRRESWDKFKFELSPNGQMDKKVIGTISAMPLIPAWAITIHKSQGLTFNQCHINLGSGAFEHGQAYVAMSRCTTLDGLTMERPIIRQDVIFDEIVQEFMRDI